MKSVRVWFDGTKIRNAVCFHLVDEGWFKEIPLGLAKWLEEQLPEKQKISFKREDWQEQKSGTQRLLWLLHTANVDPFEVCKWAKNPEEIKVMHQRFTNVIQTWYPRK